MSERGGFVATFVIDAYLEGNVLLPEHTFGMTVIDAVRYLNSFEHLQKHEFVLCDRVFRTPSHDYLTDDHIPVGGVGFVLDWFSQMGVSEVLPLNVPTMLWPYLAREVRIGTEAEVSGQYMSKSLRRFKDASNGLILAPRPTQTASRFLTRWVPGVLSEWRCFVCDGRLAGIQNYAGDPFVVPDRGYLRDVVAAYDKRAYTLDVMVYPDPKDSCALLITDIVEVHDFFACTLFGFGDYETLLAMHIAAIKDILAEYGSLATASPPVVGRG